MPDLSGESKLCTSCGLDTGPQPIENFEVVRTNPATGKTTRHSKCKTCRNVQRRKSSKDWYDRNSEYQIGQVLERERSDGKAKKPSHVPRGPETEQPISLTSKEWVELMRWGAGPSDSVRRLLAAAKAANLLQTQKEPRTGN